MTAYKSIIEICGVKKWIICLSHNMASDDYFVYEEDFHVRI